MPQRLKSLARDSLPAAYQVPIKYLYGILRGDNEEEMALLPYLVARGDHAIDIGGNRGTYAYRMWKLGSRLDIFEPNPECARILQSWAATKRDVTVHGVALSSRSGVAQLHVPIDDRGVEHDASASLEDHPSGKSHDLEVPLRPLDSYGFTDAALIKIDVEGHEASVIEGAAATIRASGPALIVEIEQRHNDRPIEQVFQRILGFGYRGFFFQDRRLVPLETFDLKRHQPREALGRKGAYFNNFLFLAAARLEAGSHTALMHRWAAA